MRTLQEIITFFQDDHFAMQQCGIQIEEATPIYARCRMSITSKHLNAAGYVQGGAIFTLCDTTFGTAANAEGVLTVSSGANITFVNPGRGAYLQAEASLVTTTKRTCLYRVEVYNECGEMVAFATVNGVRK